MHVRRSLELRHSGSEPYLVSSAHSNGVSEDVTVGVDNRPHDNPHTLPHGGRIVLRD
jgi:hypothetical protein